MMIRLQSNYHHRSLGLLTLLMIMTIMIVPFNNIMRSTVKTTTIGLSSLMINYEKYRSLSSSSTNTHYYVCAFTATNRQYTTINTQNRISLVSSSSLFTPKTTHHRSFTSLGEKTTNSGKFSLIYFVRNPKGFFISFRICFNRRGLFLMNTFIFLSYPKFQT